METRSRDCRYPLVARAQKTVSCRGGVLNSNTPSLMKALVVSNHNGSMPESSGHLVADPLELKDLLPLLRDSVAESLRHEKRETLRTLDVVRVLRRPYSCVVFL